MAKELIPSGTTGTAIGDLTALDEEAARRRARDPRFAKLYRPDHEPHHVSVGIEDLRRHARTRRAILTA